ncbi:hypothetical protein JTB14_031452 [Gonioctena quinquepunctata]|nr:hypothetical protein JTB14_031452 [Gonioctena quinquepunctata]
MFCGYCEKFQYLVLACNMYAYVKFIEDNICEYVDTSKIKHFDPDDIHLYEKKFRIQWTDGEFYPGAIIYVRDTMEELRKVVEKKELFFNKELLLSDASESDIK